MTTRTLSQFNGIYRWLSNFWVQEPPMTIDGKTYRTVEHYFQACKATTKTDHERIRTCTTPEEAKRAGRYVRLRPDWESVKTQVMLRGLQEKFRAGSLLAGWLVATGDALLVEENNWNDRVWGQVNGVGENRLGKLLMQVRREIQTP